MYDLFIKLGWKLLNVNKKTEGNSKECHLDERGWGSNEWDREGVARLKGWEVGNALRIEENILQR